LWFPDACTVHTPSFTHTLLDHPGIEVTTGSALLDWQPEPTVLACGMAARDFPGAAFLELGNVSGQLNLVNRGYGALKNLATPITGRGYLAPVDEKTIGAGATYEYEPWPAEKATAANLEHVRRLVGEEWNPSSEGAQYHKAMRCVSSDRNPIIGPLTNQEGCEDVRRLVSVGHGSMGTVTSHLAATLVAATLTGQFEPLSPRLLALVGTGRFRSRQQRRGYRFGASP
jgi:glycine/D-amino acid oxidase-like deaminating enzyme